MESQTNGVKTWQWVVTVIVIIVLILLGYYMLKGNSSTTTDTDNTKVADSSLVTNKNTNRVVVTDQFPGNIVYLSSVQLTKGGFVVIHKDKAGTPGDIIGSQYFEAGINPGKVTLTSGTMEGGVYYAMIHSDDGDKKFDITKDISLKDAAGNVIMKIFRATSKVTEVKG